MFVFEVKTWMNSRKANEIKLGRKVIQLQGRTRANNLIKFIKHRCGTPFSVTEASITELCTSRYYNGMYSFTGIPIGEVFLDSKYNPPNSNG